MILRHTSRVYRKEMQETLRDRRTIMSMIIVPVLVMPALIWGMSSVSMRMVRRAQEERVTVMLLGAENAPSLADSLRANPALEIVPPDDDYAQRIESKSLRAALEFPPNFENRLAAGAEYCGCVGACFAVNALRTAANSSGCDRLWGLCPCGLAMIAL